MGCVSSKIISRSLSYREDLNRTKQRSASDIMSLGEQSAAQKVNDHQLLALVCSANKLANSLRSKSLKSKSQEATDEPEVTMTYNTTWEVISSSEQGGKDQQLEAEAPLLLSQPQNVDTTRQSRSYHLYSSENKISQKKEDEVEDWKFKGVGRAWNFHTVEEYDVLLEKIRLSSTQEQTTSVYHANDLIKVQPNGIQEETEDLHPSAVVEEKPAIKEESILLTSEVSHSVTNPHTSSSTRMELNTNRDSSEEGCVSEKGFKRKSIAKRLYLLEIPQDVEFKAVPSLREWLHSGGQVFSPGSYITPKFGSYGIAKSRMMTNRSKEDDAVDPEFVAAFEQCMQQLDAETENILQHMEENMEEEPSN